METAWEDEELNTIWEAANVVTMKRLKFPDHGKKHIQIVANFALEMLGILKDSGINPSVSNDYGVGYDDAEIVVSMASLLHDAGNSIHREKHELIGIPLSVPIINRMLGEIGYGQRERTILRSEILSCMFSHSEDKIKPLTIEAGVLRVADALDIEKGRAKVSFAQLRDMHNIATMAIEKVEVVKGQKKPIRAEIRMSSSAGVFLLDRVVRKKLIGSGIEDYVEIHATIEKEHDIVNEFLL